MASNKAAARVLGLGLTADEAALLAALAAQEAWSLRASERHDLVILAGDERSEPSIAHWAQSGAAVVVVVDRREAALVSPSLRSGALDCLVRPLSAEKARTVLKRCLEHGALRRKVEQNQDRLWTRLGDSRLVGESPSLRSALALARKAAPFPVDMLILGETGTGKELVARLVHEHSGRGDGPFVAVDCGAINEDLADSELFGHRKGAFTGAVEDRLGLLEQAEDGTLFLDEVGNLSLAVQAKLLRALQNREIWRLGDDAAKPLNLRVIAATNADLEVKARQGEFRLDLYHRLADLQVSLPPLRSRGNDALLMAGIMLSRHRERFGLGPCELSAEAQAALLACRWPGNVRQLDNAMKQAALLAKDRVETAQLPAEVLEDRVTEAGAAPVPSQDDGAPIPEGVVKLWQLEAEVAEAVEASLIGRALRQCGGDRGQTAALLKVHPKTLARKIREHDLG